MDDLLNSDLGPYHLIDVIGRGGMSVVYKAYQPALDRFVAVKVLHVTQDSTFAARFLREARTSANLQHPNILPIYDYGEQLGRHFLAMQYIENGVTLRDMLSRPLAPATALRLASRLMEALDYAHVRGVIHRDIKPANILMQSPRWPMLTDFGIAKLLSHTQALNLTGTGLIIGTAAYMAPEQAMGGVVDARSDLYSAGVVLYEMMTGQAPFEADTPVAILMKQVYEPPPRPRGINPELPAAVESVLLRALAKDPADRYQTAVEMAEDLDRTAALLANNRPHNRASGLYQAAIQDFEAERWNLAVARFNQLLVMYPEGYQDATALLEAAREAQRRMQNDPTRRPPGDTGLQSSEISIAVGDDTFARASVLQRSAEQKERFGNLVGALNDYQRARDVTPPGLARENLNGHIVRITEQLERLSEGGIAVAPEAPRLTAPTSTRQSSPAGATKRIRDLLSQAVHLPHPSSNVLHYWPIAAAFLIMAIVVIAALRSPVTLPQLTPTLLVPTRPNHSPTPTATRLSPSATVTIIMPPAVVASATGLSLRAGPDERTERLNNYRQGTELKVLGKDEDQEWLQVQTPDGRMGWMKREFLLVYVDLSTVPIVVAPTITPTRRPRPNRPPPARPLVPAETAPPTAPAPPEQPGAETLDPSDTITTQEPPPTEQPSPAPSP
jgi:serine/threonine protein kinase